MIGARATFARIVRHEWRLMRRDGRLAGVSLALALLAAYGVQAGAAVWRSHDDRARRLETRTAERLESWQTTEAYAASAQRWDVALPVSPVMALAVGQAEVLAGTADVYTWSTPDKLLAASDLQNPERLRTGRLDLAFVIVYLAPLAAILLGYDLLASEREDGTLALLLAQPIGAATVLAAKVAARGVLILLVLVATTAVTVSALQLPVSSVDTASRLALMTTVTAAYVLSWLLLTAVVNLGRQSAAANATLLMIIWVAVLIVIPAVLTSAIAAAHPVPPRTALITADRAADPDPGRDGPPALARYRAIHTVDTSQLTPRQSNRVQLLLAFLDKERPVERMADDIREAIRRRDRALARWAWLSPALATQDTLNLLAGTGTARYRDFADRVNALVREHRAFFVPRVVAWRAVDRRDASAVPMLRLVEPARQQFVLAATQCSCALLAAPVAAWFWRLRRSRTQPV